MTTVRNCEKCGREYKRHGIRINKQGLCGRCVKNSGRPRSPQKEMVLKLDSRNGYYYITPAMLSQKERRLFAYQAIPYHRYLMTVHMGRKLERSEVVRHINGDKLDNRIENLQLGTPHDNMMDNKTAILQMNYWKSLALILLSIK